MERKEHPSYGILRLTRSTVGGEGTALFGSSILHNNVIRLTICHGEMLREGSIDRYFAKERMKDRIVEVEMSYTQFAEMVTSFNVGDGVPVTITNIGGQFIAPCPAENRQETIHREAEGMISGMLPELDARMEEIEELLSEKRVLSKDDRRRILAALENVRRTLTSEIPYMHQMFTEQMEKTMAEAKGEFESYLQGRMNDIALSAISEQMLKGKAAERDEGKEMAEIGGQAEAEKEAEEGMQMQM